MVNDLTVSREQFRLEFAADQKWRVHSKNPVTVDGQPIGPQGALLRNASVIVIGDVRMTFYEPEGFPHRLEHDGKKAGASSVPTGTPSVTVR